MAEEREIRNFAIIGNDGTGKTTIVEAMLVNSKAIKDFSHRGGEKVLDVEPEEIERKITLRCQIFSCDWKKTRFYIIDTPGFHNFLLETKNVLKYSDACIFTLHPEWGTRDVAVRIWEFAEEANLPLIVFMNMIDVENTNFERALKGAQENLRVNFLPVQFPANGGRIIVDVLKEKAMEYGEDLSGNFQTKEIPDEMRERALELKERLLESIVEVDDSVMEKYLEGKEITDEELRSAFKKAVVTRKVFPVFCGSAYYNRGIKELMDYIVALFPSPSEAKTFRLRTRNEEEREIKGNVDEPLSAFAIKTTVDHFAGKSVYLRVVSGVLKGEQELLVANKNAKEKIAQILRPVGGSLKPVEDAHPGEIVVIQKVKVISTGDSVCSEEMPLIFPPLDIPPRPYRQALVYKDREAENRGNPAIQKLLEEDPFLEFSREAQTKEFILAGMGDVHLDITLQRLKRKFNVELGYKTPKVPYKETIKGRAKAQGKYKKQSGGRGQYGDCWIEIEPLPRGKYFEFVDKIVGGVIPKNFIPSVEKGILKAMESGLVAGYPVVDVRVTLYDGSYHEVDSSDIAFQIAGSLAFKKAYEQAKPVILEPLMKVEVEVPEEYIGAITSELNSRRGRIMGMEPRGRYQVIRAEVPMREMWDFAIKLTAITQGVGSFTMEFSRYEEAPPNIAEKIIEEAKREKGEEEKE